MLKITSLISLLALTPVALGTALLPRSDITLSGNGGLPTTPNPAYILKRQSCATGKTVCGSGCMPALTTNTCCSTYYCDSGRKCDTDGACTCLATEKKCGTSCIPASASCCPLDLKYCDAAFYCSPVKGYCCKNGEDPAVCASRQGFTLPATVATSPATTSTAAVPKSTTTSTSTSTSASAVVVKSSSSSATFVAATTSTTAAVRASSSSVAAPGTTTAAATSVVVVTATANSKASASTTFVAVSSGAAVANRMDVRAVMAGVVGLVGMAAL